MALQFEVDQEVEEFVDSIPQLMTEPPWSYNDTLLTGQTVSNKNPHVILYYSLLLNYLLIVTDDYCPL